MSGTHARPALAGYRDKVTELINEGATFGAVEDAIDAQAELTEGQKGALRLFAFSLRDRAEQQSDPRAHLASVQAVGDNQMTEQARERTLTDVVEAALNEHAGAERYQRYQREARSGRATDRARPREFDANGFPVPQRNQSFPERVARLLNP